MRPLATLITTLAFAWLLSAATPAGAQTAYETVREPALRRLGSNLQAGAFDDARRDLAAYVARYPGDAVMRYNLACLRAVAGDADGSLADLAAAMNAGYPDLDRPAHDPDLFMLADDPRLTDLLDRARAARVDAMAAAALDVTEGETVGPLPMAADRFVPGMDVVPPAAQISYDAEGVAIDLHARDKSTGRVVVCIALPRGPDEPTSRRWFEFTAALESPGPLMLVGRHGRAATASAGGELTALGRDRWRLTIPWSAIHPHRPPVELALGLNVTIYGPGRDGVPGRWALVNDPDAGSSIRPGRRFAPLYLDPGETPAPLVFGRLDSYLAVGDSLSVELGLQGLPGGTTTVSQFTDRATADTSLTVTVEPGLAYLTLDYRLDRGPATGWFDLAAEVIDADGARWRWSDRGFRIHPDWFVTRHAAADSLPAAEQPALRYQLFRALRAQQSFNPHDDPAGVAEAVLAADELVTRFRATGSVVPARRDVLAGAFPVSDDALQSCRMALPEAARRSGGAPLVLVAVPPGADAEATVAQAVSAGRADGDDRYVAVIGLAPAPGRDAEAAAVLGRAAAWVTELMGPRPVHVVGIGVTAPAALLAADQLGAVRVLLLTSRYPAVADELPPGLTIDTAGGDRPLTWAVRILGWR
jgi:hypothetical protein